MVRQSNIIIVNTLELFDHWGHFFKFLNILLKMQAWINVAVSLSLHRLDGQEISGQTIGGLTNIMDLTMEGMHTNIKIMRDIYIGAL